MVRGILSPTGAAAAVIDAAIERQFVLVTSFRLIEELADVLGRPRITAKYEIDAQRLAGVLDVLEFADVVPGIPRRPFIERDPDDDWVVAPALEGRADIIVTEDYDLLALSNIEGVRIVSAADFMKTLRRER